MWLLQVCVLFVVYDPKIHDDGGSGNTVPTVGAMVCGLPVGHCLIQESIACAGLVELLRSHYL